MNVLIVHAHPEPGSFCTALRDAAVDTLTAAGHQVVVSDLYAMGFNPVAGAADFGDRKNPDYLVYALEQRHGAETGSLAPDIRAEIDKVRNCDLLILTFPIFWMSMPAMLKGWIDRVFVSGLFYGGRRVYDRGGMAGKKALVATTLGGREHMFGAGSLHGELVGASGMLRHLLQGSLGYVGMNVLEPFVAYHVPYVSAEARAAELDRWRAELGRLDQRAALPVPSLAHFDDSFRPLEPHPERTAS
jgi:NAD(P)H dehydrogenase (quinone)